MFQRLMTLVKGFFSLFISGMEKSNPEAVLEAEKENLRTQIAHYNQGLAMQAALCERLNSNIKRLTAEEQDLRAKTTANLRAGNRDVAAQYALRLQTVTAELASNQTELETSEKTYQELVKSRDVAITAAKAKLDSLSRSINDMKIQKAQAEMSEMASGMISSIGSSGDSLDRLTEQVTEERDKAAGRARVARDSLDTSGIKMKESEQHAMADQALADFAAKSGIVLDPPAGAPAVAAPEQTKSMGPATDVAKES